MKQDKNAKREKRALFFRLMGMMKKRFWIYLVAILIMGMTLSGFQTVTAFLLKNIIKMAQSGSMNGLLTMVIKNIVIGLVVLLLYQVGSFTYTMEAKKGCATIQRAIFFKSMRLPYAYYENTHSGDFMSKMMYDGDRASDIYGSRFRRILMPAVMTVFYLVPMFYLSWQVTICLMVVCIMTFIVNSLFVKPMKNIGKALSHKHATLTEDLSNILSGMEQAKMFELDEKLVDSYVGTNGGFLKGQKKKNMLSAGLQGLNEGFDLLSSLAYLAVGVYFVSKNITTVDTIAAIYVMYGSLSWNFLQIGYYIPDLMNLLANVQRVFEFLDLEEEEVCYKQIGGVDDRAYIAIDHVDFMYDVDDDRTNKILNDFSMRVQKGTTVALTGASGKGKSTIAKILLGFYKIQSGQISIDGRAYGSMTLEEIRDMIGYVPQEPYLYNVSIAENISYGKENVTMEQIIEAAKAANAHNFIIKQENGYDTIVGERGNRLSGGEKQRIAIARAILKNAPILILDEATSALDNESERLVSEALEALMVGRTTIMIAHRLSTIERADVVVQLN